MHSWPLLPVGPRLLTSWAASSAQGARGVATVGGTQGHEQFSSGVSSVHGADPAPEREAHSPRHSSFSVCLCSSSRGSAFMTQHLPFPTAAERRHCAHAHAHTCIHACTRADHGFQGLARGHPASPRANDSVFQNRSQRAPCSPLIPKHQGLTMGTVAHNVADTAVPLSESSNTQMHTHLCIPAKGVKRALWLPPALWFWTRTQREPRTRPQEINLFQASLDLCNITIRSFFFDFLCIYFLFLGIEPRASALSYILNPFYF